MADSPDPHAELRRLAENSSWPFSTQLRVLLAERDALQSQLDIAIREKDEARADLARVKGSFVEACALIPAMEDGADVVAVPLIFTRELFGYFRSLRPALPANPRSLDRKTE